MHAGRIYLLGGWNERETQDKVFCYDPQTCQTTFIGYLPYQVESACLAVFEDTLYLLGGFDSFGVTDRVIRVNLRTWEAEIDTQLRLALARENHTCQILNGDTLVIAGGWSEGKSID